MPEAELELSIRRQESSYALDARFTSPAHDVQPVANILLQLDHAALRALHLDPVAYGRTLSAALFVDPRVRAAWQQACAVAQQSGVLRLRIRLDVSDPDLHSIMWETLRDPEDDTPLALSERIRLSRYLEGFDFSPLVTPRRPALRALIVVANPSDLDRYGLAPVDVAGEVASARAALDNIPTTVIADGFRATLTALAAALRDGPHLVILVCHGSLVQGQPYLWLEREDGTADKVAGKEFVQAVAQLATRPLLLVLASCQSAGHGYSDALSALGPQLARVGVYGVLAFQGNVAMAAVRRLLAVLITELRRDGSIDRALAVARASLQEESDWWLPVLTLRVRDGQLWLRDALESSAEQAYQVAGLPNPYLGLRSFTYTDRELFAGRERLVSTALAHLTTPGDERALLFVTGPSGSGKSSLVQAGLLPALEGHYAGRFLTLRHAIMRPSKQPLAALADVLHQVRVSPDGPFAAVAPFTLGEISSPRPDVAVLVIDQFEELFIQSEQDQRKALLDLLGNLPAFREIRVHIICTLRNDFLNEFAGCRGLEPVFREQVLLWAMNKDELQEAIQRPIQKLHPAKHIEPALVKRLAHDAMEDATYLPLLQVTLEDLWRGGDLRLSAYQGLANAIQRRADDVFKYRDYDGLQQQQRDHEEQALILSLLLSMVRVSLAEKQPIASWRRARIEITQGDPRRERLVTDLASARLLRTDRELIQEGGKGYQIETVDIIHEALLANWSIIKDRIDNEQETLRYREHFILALKEWLSKERDEAYLLETVRLSEAEGLKQLNDSVFQSNAAEDFFIRSVQRRNEEQQRELEQTKRLKAEAEGRATAEARAREEAEAHANVQRKSNQQLRSRNIWLTIAALVAFVFGSSAVWFGVTAQQREEDAKNNEATAIAERQRADAQAATTVAERQRADAQAATAVAERLRVEQQGRITSARQLAGFARTELEEHPQRSILLAIEALNSTLDYGEPPIGSAEEALRDALATVQGVGLGNPSGRIEDIAFSPDSQLLAAGSSRDPQEELEGGISIWDITQPGLASARRVLPGHPNTTRRVIFSPDGRLLATIGDGSGGKLWKVGDNNTEAIDLSGTSSLSPLAFSADSTLLATAGNDNGVYLWDVRNTTPRIVPQILSGHTNDVKALSFTQDGRWLISFAEDESSQKIEIFLWSMISSSTIANPVVLNVTGVNRSSLLAVSNDSHWLATSLGDGQLAIWDLLRVQSVPDPILIKEAQGVQTIVFSHDSRWLTTGTNVYDVSTITADQRILTLPVSLPYLVFSHDNELLIGANRDGTIIMWDFPKLRERATLKAPEGSLNSIIISPDDRWLASSGLFGDKTVRLWDLKSRQLTKPLDPVILNDHQDDVTVTAISHQWIAIAGGAKTTDPDLRDGTIHLYNRRDLSSRPLVLSGHSNIAEFLKISSNNLWLVSVSNPFDEQSSSPEINLWPLSNIADDPPPLVLTAAQSGEIKAVVLSGDSRWLAVAGSDRQGVRLWDLSSNNININPVILPSTDVVSALAINNTSKELAVGYENGQIRVYLLEPLSPKPRLILEGHQDAITTLAYSSNSKWLGSSSADDAGRMWPMTVDNPGAEVQLLIGHSDAVTSIDISPDESLVVTGSEDGTARIWRLTENGIQGEHEIVRGHEGSIYFVGFMENGKKLVTASIKPGLQNADGTVRVWSLSANGAILDNVQLRHGEDKIVSVAMDPSGQWLLTGGDDYIGRLWTLDLQTLMILGCRAAGRSLTVTEWDIYLSNSSYRATCSQVRPQTTIPSTPTPVPTLPVPTATSAQENPVSTAVTSNSESLTSEDTVYVERVSDNINRIRQAVNDLGDLVARAGHGEDIAVEELEESIRKVETLLTESESIQPTNTYVQAHTKYKQALSNIQYAVDQLKPPAGVPYRAILEDRYFMGMAYDSLVQANNELGAIWD